MCITCGCGRPHDNHGDARNITLEDLDQAAQAAGTTREKVIQNIMHSIQYGRDSSADQEQSTGSASGQSQNQGQQGGQASRAQSPAQSTATRPMNENVNDQPGTYQPSPGKESGMAYRKDEEDLNYQPPEEQRPY